MHVPPAIRAASDLGHVVKLPPPIMPIEVNIKSNIKDLERRVGLLGRKVIPKATFRALRETTKYARSQSVKTVARASSIKQKDVRAKLFYLGPYRATMRGIVIGKAYAPNLIRFRARQAKEGVKANVYESRNKLHKGAFIANQGRTVFRRTGEPKTVATKGIHAGKMREPIAPVIGPSVRKLFEHSLDGLEALVQSRFSRELTRAFKFEVYRTLHKR